ncbi:MAG: hypothetical protein QW437_06705, partial [Fervidicoccaceae archaeon]
IKKLVVMSDRERKRRFLAISEDVIVEAMNVGERVGIPFTALIENILSDVLRIMKYKPEISSAIAYADSMDDILRLGGVVLPWEVVKKVIENMSEEERKEMMDELYRMSSWYAELAKVKRGSSLLELKNTISIWIPSANLDIAEEDGSYKIIVSFRDSQSSLLDFAERIVEGLLKGYGLKMIGKERKSSLLVFKVTGFYE